MERQGELSSSFQVGVPHPEQPAIRQVDRSVVHCLRHQPRLAKPQPQTHRLDDLERFADLSWVDRLELRGCDAVDVIVERSQLCWTRVGSFEGSHSQLCRIPDGEVFRRGVYELEGGGVGREAVGG